MNEKPTAQNPSKTETVPAETPRRRLRMQPLARDNFMTLVYVCVAVLLLGEFVALFWLDLFD